jgi:hypothetical protein
MPAGDPSGWHADPPTGPTMGPLGGSDRFAPLNRATMIRPVLFLLPYLAIIGLCGIAAHQAGTSLRERAECRAVAAMASLDGQSEHRCP